MRKIDTYLQDKIQVLRSGYAPYGQPKMFVNLFYIDGLLIDTGQKHMRKEILNQVKPLMVQQIFITHYHEDHSGNIGPLQNYFQVPSYAPPLTVQLMKDPPWVSPAQRISWGKPDANTQLIAHNKAIKTPKYQFELIPIPGHSKDMVALYEANEGWLFSADLYVHHYIRYFKREEIMYEQIASLKKLLQLDFKQLFCSHSKMVKKGREKLQQKLQFFEDFYGAVQNLKTQGCSPNEIMHQLQIKENWTIRIISLGELSAKNLVLSAFK